MATGQRKAPTHDDEREGVFFFCIGQPHMPHLDDPNYSETMLTPQEKREVADRLSELGLRDETACPNVIDHAGLTGSSGLYRPNGTLPDEKRVGRVHDVMVDKDKNLIVMGQIYGSRPEAKIILADIKQNHAKWGVSLWTDYGRNATTGRVEKLRIGHLGITKNPAFGREGTWIYEVTDNYDAMQRIMRKYIDTPGMYVSAATRRKYAHVGSPSPSAQHDSLMRVPDSEPGPKYDRPSFPTATRGASKFDNLFQRKPGSSFLRPSAMSAMASSVPSDTISPSKPMSENAGHADPMVGITSTTPAPLAVPVPAVVGTPSPSTVPTPVQTQQQQQQQQQPQPSTTTNTARPDKEKIKADIRAMFSGLQNSTGYARLEKAKGILAHFDSLISTKQLEMHEIFEDFEDVYKTARADEKKLSEAPLRTIDSLGSKGLLQPPQVEQVKEMYSYASVHNSPNTRVICEYMQAHAEESSTNQRDYEVQKAELYKYGQENVTLKRSLEEASRELNDLRRKNQELEEKTKNLVSVYHGDAASSMNGKPAAPNAAAPAVSTPALVESAQRATSSMTTSSLQAANESLAVLSRGVLASKRAWDECFQHFARGEPRTITNKRYAFEEHKDEKTGSVDRVFRTVVSTPKY